MVRTLRPKKCRREGRFSERTHRKMAILSLYSVILSLRGCLIYERHVRRSEVSSNPDCYSQGSVKFIQLLVNKLPYKIRQR